MKLDQRDCDCRVYTFKDGGGALSSLAHDLELAVTRFSVEMEEGAGETGTYVTARFDAGSLRVRTAMSDGKPVRALVVEAQAGAIERTIAEEILVAARHPEIRFTSTRVSGAGDTREIEGTLALHGVERPITVTATLQELAAGRRWVAAARLHTPDFGIRAYSALLGTLRLQPDVTVRLTVPQRR